MGQVVSRESSGLKRYFVLFANRNESSIERKIKKKKTKNQMIGREREYKYKVNVPG